MEPTERRGEPSRDALPAGTRLAEYELLSVLGEGRFGIVYLAMDHGLQRQVAIKEYLPAALAARGRETAVALRSDGYAQAFAAGLGSFIDEARLLARFDHPALARVHRFWEANGTAYVAMPYYEGVSLGAAREAMAQPPDEAWLRELLLPLLDALEVLHGASCFPRDLSPENILLLPDGRPVLLDLGTARHAVGDRTDTLAATLRPGFAPIEQYAESTTLRQGPWTNLYALAALAYYCIGGRAPTAATARALDDRMDPLFEVVDRLGRDFPELDYSVAFVSAIERALRVRPEERPQSVAEFRRALLGGRSAAEPAAARPAVAEAAPPREAPIAFAAPPGGAPHADDDDTALRAALEAALRPEPHDPGRSPPPQRGGGRRILLAGVAVVVLAVLAAGGWMMWSDRREAGVAPPTTALATKPEAPPAPILPAEPRAQAPAPAPSGAAAEPRLPPPEAAAPPAPQPPPAPEKAAVAETPAETSPPAPPPPPAAAKKAPSRAPAAQVADKEPDNPRELCGPRTQFSLYRCMKAACERPKYYDHAECKYLRMTDRVRPGL